MKNLLIVAAGLIALTAGTARAENLGVEKTVNGIKFPVSATSAAIAADFRAKAAQGDQSEQHCYTINVKTGRCTALMNLDFGGF